MLIYDTDIVTSCGGNQSTRRKSPTCRKSLDEIYHIMLYLVWAGFKLTTLVVIGTDCIGSYKSSISSNFIIKNCANCKITSYIYIFGYLQNQYNFSQAFCCTNEKGKCEKIFCCCNYRSYPSQHIDQWPWNTQKVRQIFS
jgi:hypothetical protein